MVELRNNIEPMLHQFGVQLAVSGHYHNVQRQSAVFRNKVVQKATTVIDAQGNAVATHVDANATIWMIVGTGGTINMK